MVKIKKAAASLRLLWALMQHNKNMNKEQMINIITFGKDITGHGWNFVKKPLEMGTRNLIAVFNQTNN